MYPYSGCGDPTLGFMNCSTCDDSNNDERITTGECFTCNAGFTFDYLQENCKCKANCLKNKYLCIYVSVYKMCKFS